MGGVELQAIEVEFDGAPGVRANQVAEVVGELLLGQGVDVLGKVATDAPNGAGVGVDGFRLQAFEFEVFKMQLILPIKMRGRGSVHVGIFSRCVANSRHQN